MFPKVELPSLLLTSILGELGKVDDRLELRLGIARGPSFDCNKFKLFMLKPLIFEAIATSCWVGILSSTSRLSWLLGFQLRFQLPVE